MIIGARVSATGDYFKGGVQEREPADAPVLLQHRISRRLIPDHYGHELPNLAAAQSKAHTLAQQMLAPAEHWRKAEFSIMSNGHEVARVPFARLEALPLNGPAAIMSGFKSAKRAACSQDRPWAQSELNAAVKGVSFGLTVVMARDHHPFGGAMRMAAMDHFDHILHWKLKQGSHAFPGKDGGTCINEAAIVAAGFPYQPVRSVEDMPACFSRPICALAMQLNDGVFDEERQQLLPFVTRLACADTPMVEREREAYIVAHTRWRLPFQEGITVLEGALAIGRQAGVSAPDEVRTRMEAVQARATIPTSVPGTPLFAKMKKWFGTKETASAG